MPEMKEGGEAREPGADAHRTLPEASVNYTRANRCTPAIWRQPDSTGIS